MALPSMYRCSICGLPLRPTDQTVERKAVVWLKSKGKTINRVIEELYEYKHEACSDKEPVSNEVPLF